MFQRLKGAIDSRIAEEQARQKGAQNTPPRPHSTPPRHSASRALSPSKRPARATESDVEPIPAGKGPDPLEFVIGDEDGTAPAAMEQEKASMHAGDNTTASSDAVITNGGKNPERPTANEPAVLPPDVQAKLRKLEKLESKYHELLRSYRIAHARVSAIEPFEASLRENTPLTSINEAGALVEYLGQLNLKGEMVMEELKRVSTERDSFRKRLEEAEKETRHAYDELTNLRRDKGASELSPSLAAKGKEESQGLDLPNHPRTSVTAVNIGAASSEVEQENAAHDQAGGDFFNYDTELSQELPRLRSDLQERESQIASLKLENETMKSDLLVAKESAEQLMRRIEDTTSESENKKSELEAAKAELANLEDLQDQNSSTVERLNSELSTIRAELESLQMTTTSHSSEEIQRLSDEVARLESDLDQSRSALTLNEKRNQTLKDLVETLKSQLRDSENAAGNATSRAEVLREELDRLSHQLDNARNEESIAQAENNQDLKEASAITSSVEPGTSGKKKNKKKKRPGKQPESSDAPTNDEPPSVHSENAVSSGGGAATVDEHAAERVAELEKRLAAMQAEVHEKDAAIDRLHAKLKDQEALREEIETLKDDLVNVGQEHVTAKDKLKELLTEKTALEEHVKELEREISDLGTHAARNSEMETERQTLAANFDELKAKASALETDVAAAEKLAAARFKEMTELRDVLQRAQPELKSLRSEDLEAREDDLRSEIASQQKRISQVDEENKGLKQRIDSDTKDRTALEAMHRITQQDLQRVQGEKNEVTEASARLMKDLDQAQEEARISVASLTDLQQQVDKLTRDTEVLRDETELKTAQHASAQSLMARMRDQTSEMAMQMKEARERCDGLEEELADVHRLLSERNRESETMRRLLADVETRTESRIKDMRERLDQATEERDRAEDEASNVGRRRARELEDVRGQLREAERNLRRQKEAREESEKAENVLRQELEELQQKEARATQGADEVRQAMNNLRDALDEGERQARELEKEKADLRRVVDDTQQRLEKLQKANKVMADELKSMRGARIRPVDSNIQSSRSSFESSPSRGLISSPTTKSSNSIIQPNQSPGPPGAGSTMDYVYLKNVLLQFLEQRDKKHQMQLIPVLGMLLHFDRGEEQKLIAAISAR